MWYLPPDARIVFEVRASALSPRSRSVAYHHSHAARAGWQTHETPLRTNPLSLDLLPATHGCAGWSEGLIRAQALFPSAGEAAGSAAPAVRVLLVDDHEDTNRSLALLLGRRGYKVKTATSLAAAEVLCDLEPCDVLVCDMSLPDGSGLELLAASRAGRRGWVPSSLSGYNTDEDIDRSLAAGYKAHLGKPVELDKLDATIKRLGR